MDLLTDEDKISIVNQHKKNLEYLKYGLQISILEEQAIDSHSESVIISLNKQISEIDKKIKALDTELLSLS